MTPCPPTVGTAAPRREAAAPTPGGGGGERALLDLALRPLRGEAVLATARELVGECDRRRLLALAGDEGLTCLLGGLLEEAAALPPEMEEAVAAARRRAVAWEMRSGEAWGSVLDGLEERGLAPLVLKGPALAAPYYDPSWLRDSEDLDLLVRRGRAGAAVEALAGLGFRRPGGAPPALGRIESFFDGTTTLVRGDGLSVDVHDRLSRADFRMGFDEEGFHGRAVPVPVSGRAARTLAPEDLLHYLCVHGCKDLWRRRVWISDIARLLIRHPGLDGARVVADAGRAGTRRALGVGLALAARLLDAPPHPGELAALAAEEPSAGLAAAVFEEPEWDPSAPPAGECLRDRTLPMRFRERWTDRARVLLGAALVPRRTDWEALPVPGWAVPVLFPFRPLRLSWTWGRRLLAGGR